MSVAVAHRERRRQQPLELGRLLQYGLAMVSLGGGLIHLSAAGDHSSQALEAGLFVGAAATQIVWAGLVLRSRNRLLLGAGANLSLVLIACWTLTRTTGLSLLGGAVEPIGFKDGIAVLLEVAVLVGVALLALLPAEGRALLVPAGRYAGGASFLAVAALTVTALVFAPAHPGGGHAGAEEASGHHGEANGELAAAGHSGDEAHAEVAGAHAAGEDTHGVAGAAHTDAAGAAAHPADGHAAGAVGHGADAASGMDMAAHGGHGAPSSNLVAAAGTSSEGHAGHGGSANGSSASPADHSAHGGEPAGSGTEIDHSAHGADPASGDAQTDHSAHGSEPSDPQEPAQADHDHGASAPEGTGDEEGESDGGDEEEEDSGGALGALRAFIEEMRARRFSEQTQTSGS